MTSLGSIQVRDAVAARMGGIENVGHTAAAECQREQQGQRQDEASGADWSGQAHVKNPERGGSGP